MSNDTKYHITCSFVNDFNRQEDPSTMSLLSDSNTKIFNPHSTNETNGEYLYNTYIF